MKNSVEMPKSFLAMGLTPVETTVKRRLLLSTEGMDGTGKTEFALTAPGPVVLLDMDVGVEGVVEKWAKKKAIGVHKIRLPIAGSQKDYIALWNKAETIYTEALKNKDVRTLIVDTGSDFWELLRLADFGKLTKVTPERYAESVYPIYRGLIRMAYDSHVNLIITHRLKKQYVKSVEVTKSGNRVPDSWNGNWEKAGMTDTNYLIQVGVRHFRDSTTGEFGFEVHKCRHNSELVGMEFRGAECNFPCLASYVMPDTKESDWK